MDVDPLVYVNCRDRVTDLRLLVAWLERAGHQRIILLDNASTWPPLLEYLVASPHTVVRLTENVGARAVWRTRQNISEPFVVTDPDVIPCEDCPLDAVDHLWDLIQRTGAVKAGLGLRLDDVPPDMPSLPWERELVKPGRQILPGAFDSLIDTTFALHRPDTQFQFEAIRTGHPYLARHTTWYRRELDDEHAYYLAHALRGDEGTTWEAP